jgi:DNA-binding NarL/FixJ family response regulator
MTLTQGAKMKRNQILIVDPLNIIGGLWELICDQYNDNVQIFVDVRRALDAIEAHPPDAIIIYLWGPEMNSFEFCEHLRASTKSEKIPVLVWGMRPGEEVYERLQQAGACGYVKMPCHPQRMKEGRAAALAGETYYPPREET